jgi:hypothetical protein
MKTTRGWIGCGVALLAVALAPAPACLFDTREAQEPITSLDCEVVSLDTPVQAFVAIEKSLEECKQDANYERAISANFVFSPTLTDSLDQNFIGTGVYDNWTKQVEMDVLKLLLSDAQKLSVSFTPSVLINKNTFVRYRVDYTLDVIAKATPTDTTRYAGVAQFDVRNEGGNWRVTFWDEIETVAGYSTWGFLKGVLRLRLNP